MAWTQVANNAKTTLSAECTDVATAITPTAKTTFPDPEDDGSFYVTIWDADTYPDPGDDPGMEIVLVTADAAANWTVTRAQAGTAGAAHVAGDAVRLLWLAEHATEIRDAVDLNTAHRTSVGTDHTYIDQNVTTTGTPQFGKVGLGAAAGTARITLVAGTTAVDGIDFGGDVTLYRSDANVLKTDDTVDAVGGFKDNGVAGIDTTFLDNDGNTITVRGGIITAKTAP